MLLENWYKNGNMIAPAVKLEMEVCLRAVILYPT